MNEVFAQKPSARLTRGVLWGGVGLLCVVVAGTVLLHLQGGRQLWWPVKDVLHTFGAVPDFTLFDQGGQQVTRADLLGKVWVVDFIFTRCVDECPLMSNHMARLQQTFGQDKGLHWVSITLDPEYDTIEVLARYAMNFGAQADRWWFLTGDKKVIYRLAREGFHLGVQDPSTARRPSAVPLFPRNRQAMWNLLQVLQPGSAWAHHGAHPEPETSRIVLHSARFALVDRQGQIRGYYDSREEDAMRRLRRHIAYLLQEDV